MKSSSRTKLVRARHMACSLVMMSVVLLPSACAQEMTGDWLNGFWMQTQDEDGQPLDDAIEFRSGGTFVSHAATCDRQIEARFHFYAGDVYVVATTSKGKISMLLVPSADRKTLVMTSVRTGNNSTYERIAGVTSCKEAFKK